MSVLRDCKPENVFAFFEQLCSVPHGSGNTKQISDLCYNFARARGLECYQDGVDNVIIIKEATPGFEGSSPVILQGHLDMVCAKTSDSTIDFLTDGLTLGIDGDWVYAQGTSLGADNCIAVAMIMAILDSDGFPHPRIEAVFTVDEETGMEGAAMLDVSPLKAKLLMNLDSEKEGVLTVSCAGGVRANCTLPVTRKNVSALRTKLTIGGLKGGHSGVEIDKGRGSSNQLIGRLLYAMRKAAPFGISNMSGGSADNIIPLLTTAELAVAPENLNAVLAVVTEYDAIYKRELLSSDSGVFAALEVFEMGPLSTADLSSTDKMIFALLNLPHGVQVMSMDIQGLVQTSLNLGILHMDEDALRFSFGIRTSVATQKVMLTDRIRSITQLLGGSVNFYGDYPGWAFKKDSNLREVCIETYRGMYGVQPTVMAIHAGLECGLLAGKIQDLDCISLGPNLKDVHSVNERVSISSVERIYNYITEVLKNLK